jgi:glycerol-3-phosphate dehydrogenase
MKRDLAQLSNNIFDLCIIGGGIYGACVAWDAVNRGLSVALVDKGDFGHATSANSGKVVHGGFRYLQHGDLVRIRESIKERGTLLRIAPHLVRLMPYLMPTYGHGLMGPEVLRLALAVYDLIGWDKNHGINDPDRRVPPGRILSRQKCLRLVPGIRDNGLTGGAIWNDGQILNSERLALAFLRSAEQSGAVVANYVRVTGLIREGNRVMGVRTADGPSGQTFEIRGRLVLNASGPWVGRVLELAGAKRPAAWQFCKMMNLIVRRPLLDGHALVVGTPARPQDGLMDRDALIRRNQRFLYLKPWRAHTIIGSLQVRYEGVPDGVQTTPEEIQGFLDEINYAYPAAQLTFDDVSFVHRGLVPITPRAAEVNAVDLAKHALLTDHARDGLDGLISVLGVKYTTARLVAERTIDLVLRKLGYRSPKSVTAAKPVYGGAIERLEEFVSQEVAARPSGVGAETIRHLIEQYGSEYPSVLRLMKEKPALGHPLGEATLVVGAEVIHAVRFEMAQRLADVVFRRTELGTSGNPGEDCLKSCARIMAQELGWDDARVQRELHDVEGAFPAATSVGRLAATPTSDR